MFHRIEDRDIPLETLLRCAGDSGCEEEYDCDCEEAAFPDVAAAAQAVVAAAVYAEFRLSRYSGSQQFYAVTIYVRVCEGGVGKKT